MLFNTALFLWFFATFFVLYSFVVLRHTPRLYLILSDSDLMRKAASSASDAFPRERLAETTHSPV